MTTETSTLELDPYRLGDLSDDALLAGTRTLVARTNHALAALLAHLAEVEARGIHRTRACSSLYTYCIYELRMSEDAAFRRAKAAKLCRRFPVLYDHVAAGELHLTGLLLLGPHLTDDNLADVLARAKHRTKREIQKLVRLLDPLPAVPARVEPLGPGPGIATPRAPTWGELVASFNPVRELEPGERPRDWMGEDNSAGGGDTTTTTRVVADGGDTGNEGAEQRTGNSAREPAPLPPQHYKVQFTAAQEYVDLLERARDLLSHAIPDRSIEEVHLRALRLLVTELEKKKYARRNDDPPRQRGATAPHRDDPRQRGAQSDDPPRQRGASEPHRDAPRQRGATERDRDAPRQRGANTRVIPAAVRRAVRERDGARCTYVAPSGERCRETAFLELHHEQPFARGGAATASNLRLRCRAHNALAAEQDFGRTFM